MINLHKLLRQFTEISIEDADILRDLIGDLNRARRDFEYVGTEFTYEGFKAYYKRINANNASSPHSPYDIKLLKIVEGDNLDIIEEAAEKKGLL